MDIRIRILIFAILGLLNVRNAEDMIFWEPVAALGADRFGDCVEVGVDLLDEGGELFLSLAHQLLEHTRLLPYHSLFVGFIELLNDLVQKELLLLILSLDFKSQLWFYFVFVDGPRLQNMPVLEREQKVRKTKFLLF